MAKRSSRNSNRPTRNGRSSKAQTPPSSVTDDPASVTEPCPQTSTLHFRHPDELNQGPPLLPDDLVSEATEKPGWKPTTPFGTYLREIRQHRLLTVEQEQRLSRRLAIVHDHLYVLLGKLHSTLAPHVSQIQTPLWSTCCLLYQAPRWIPVAWEQLDRCLHEWVPTQVGKPDIQAAVSRLHAKLRRTHRHWAHLRDQFISANLRLVVHVARYYARTSVPIADLIQAGNVGLMQAIDRFDPRLGTRLSTYSVMWIKEAMSRMVNAATHHAAPLIDTDPDLSSETGRTAAYHASLDRPVHRHPDEYEAALLNLLPDLHSPTPEDVTVDCQLQDRLRQAMETLDQEQRHILELRHGLRHDRNYTLEEIAAKLALTRDQVRHKQNQAYERLRTGPYSHILREFLHD